MRLILGSTPHNDFPDSTWAAEALGMEIIDVGSSEQWGSGPSNPLEVGDKELLLLCHTRPEYAVAHAVENGKSPAEALAHWRDGADAIMRAFRRRRERTVVVDGLQALRHPQAFATACTERFGISLADQQLPAAREPDRENRDDLSLLIATQLVAQDAAMADLLGELEAASIPLDEPEQAPQLDSERLQALHREFGDVHEENELLLLQLHQVQEELETYYLEYKAAQQQAEKNKKAADEYKKQINRMRYSTSWRITMPIRVLMRLLKGKPLRGKNQKKK